GSAPARVHTRVGGPRNRERRSGEHEHVSRRGAGTGARRAGRGAGEALLGGFDLRFRAGRSGPRRRQVFPGASRLRAGAAAGGPDLDLRRHRGRGRPPRWRRLGARSDVPRRRGGREGARAPGGAAARRLQPPRPGRRRSTLRRDAQGRLEGDRRGAALPLRAPEHRARPDHGHPQGPPGRHQGRRPPPERGRRRHHLPRRQDRAGPGRAAGGRGGARGVVGERRPLRPARPWPDRRPGGGERRDLARRPPQSRCPSPPRPPRPGVALRHPPDARAGPEGRDDPGRVRPAPRGRGRRTREPQDRRRGAAHPRTPRGAL
ncbi:MAG: phospholipid/glycerol acyltransferase, partial [uncultured Rubrobacteraceae bacterium]